MRESTDQGKIFHFILIYNLMKTFFLLRGSSVLLHVSIEGVKVSEQAANHRRPVILGFALGTYHPNERPLNLRQREDPSKIRDAHTRQYPIINPIQSPCLNVTKHYCPLSSWHTAKRPISSIFPPQLYDCKEGVVGTSHPRQSWNNVGFLP